MNADEAATRKTLESLLAESPFQRLLGLRLDAFDLAAQTVTIRSIYGPNVERSSGTGQYHGGEHIEEDGLSQFRGQHLYWVGLGPSSSIWRSQMAPSRV